VDPFRGAINFTDDGDDWIVIVRIADKMNKLSVTHFLQQEAALLSLLSESSRKRNGRHGLKPEQQEGR
jgi:hypothetical protein